MFVLFKGKPTNVFLCDDLLRKNWEVVRNTIVRLGNGGMMTVSLDQLYFRFF